MRTHLMRTRRKTQRQTVITMEPEASNTQFNTITEEEENEITESDSQEDPLDNPQLQGTGGQFININDKMIYDNPTNHHLNLKEKTDESEDNDNDDKLKEIITEIKALTASKDVEKEK